MKLSEASKYLPLIQAAAEGKAIQYKSKIDGSWIDKTRLDDDEWPNPDYEYRIKPEPKLRPWKPEEVPVGAWIRSASRLSENACALICSRGNGGIGSFSFQEIVAIQFEEALHDCEYSIDGGKTWLKCGIEE